MTHRDPEGAKRMSKVGRVLKGSGSREVGDEEKRRHTLDNTRPCTRYKGP